MKIQIQFTVEIDYQSWCDEYNRGRHVDPADIRAELREHAQSSMDAYLQSIGVQS